MGSGGVAGKIFVNYRRGDDPGFTQALYQRLEDEFTADNLFMDVEGHIKPGDDFVHVLNDQVAGADVLLAVIGPRWIDLLAARKGDSDDFVAIEIKAALENGKRVIPVLVGGAGMPRADFLPEAIRALARRNAVGLRPDRFKADCQGLITALKEQLAAAVAERDARTESERQAAEAARQEADAQAAARARVAEERGRAQAAAGLSPEEIRKAEELASWDFVKDRSNIQDLRDHLARFPGGTTERYGLAKIDGLVWTGLGSMPGLQELQAYLDEFPKGAHAEAAQTRIVALNREAADREAAEARRAQETAEWGAVAVSTNREDIETFLKQWPDGQHRAAARARIVELRQGSRGVLRGIFIGAGGTVPLLALALYLFVYPQIQMWPVFWNVSTAVLSTQAEQTLHPGDGFKECVNCPEMVVVPSGQFTMGLRDGRESEKPAHLVIIGQRFAAGKFVVTFDQWDACVAHGGCRHNASDNGWGRANRPVIDVNWDDAKEYVAWMSKLTGKTYRLLTEADWEYAARAGTTTTYYWGSSVGKGNANCDGCGSTSDNRETAPVGSFTPNSFGLYDMAGNVWQWTEDCYNSTYNGAPANGSPWVLSGDCSRRVVRGGSWRSYPDYLRTAVRDRGPSVGRVNFVGFRVARTLSQ
jgi:formylglycine-generating enzyme required for sulfatase activity